MVRTMRILLCSLALCACASLARAGETPAAYALVVSGSGGEANFSANLIDWSRRWQAALTDVCKLPPENVRILMEKKEDAPNVAADTSTKEHLKAELAALAKKLKPGDQFILVLNGHGTVMGETAKLCLPGPDLSAAELSDLLDTLPNREVIVVQTASASSLFVDALSRPGRIVVTACSDQGQGNATYFNEFFLGGLEKKKGDADKDGKLTVLEAFNHAATHCAKWYLRQYYEGQGVWRVDGKQSQQLWQKFYSKVPERKMTPGENGDDPEPELGEWGPQWEGRRMVTETAQLDDNGDRQGTAVYVSSQFVKLVGADDGLDGYLAGKTVLGAPRGDTAAPEKSAAGGEDDAGKGQTPAP